MRYVMLKSIDLEPTSWDILLRVATDENGGWDGEDCEFRDYDSAYTFGLKLVELTPRDVEL